MSSTIKDVAKRARVSVSTVSRVINGTARVSEETRQRVLRTVETLNYRPNLLAQSLKRKKSRTIGLIVENIANPFFPDVVRGVEEAAHRYGYSVFLCNNGKDFRRGLEHLDVLQKRGADGIIYSSMGRIIQPTLALKILQLSEAGIPTVLLWRRASELDTAAVLNDESGGARKAIAHLLNLGHRKIAFVGGFSDSAVTKQRYDGYRSTLEENGIEPDEGLVLFSDFEVSGGFEAALELFRHNPPPTAIFTANDLMAIGVMLAAKQTGRRVPEELAVVGFDDIRFSELTDPPLTTVRVPKYEMGLNATEKLLELLGERDTQTPNTIVLESDLIVRRSCGAKPDYAPVIQKPSSK
ncbi:MAG: LacI family transcriptional regulator [Firmicutes bacterium]|nr:LacI family transcriptional regulator [Bacillota bacterium]MCL5038761.1 LacI family transcriptional regulator [Bacillota bacterium]